MYNAPIRKVGPTVKGHALLLKKKKQNSPRAMKMVPPTTGRFQASHKEPAIRNVGILWMRNPRRIIKEKPSAKESKENNKKKAISAMLSILAVHDKIFESIISTS